MYVNDYDISCARTRGNKELTLILVRSTKNSKADFLRNKIGGTAGRAQRLENGVFGKISRPFHLGI